MQFLPSFTDQQRGELLQACRAVIYTPAHEHFGIVPLEAMAAGRPVIAVASGGPLETVKPQSTGLLCEPQPEAFARAMTTLSVRLDFSWPAPERAGCALFILCLPALPGLLLSSPQVLDRLVANCLRGRMHSRCSLQLVCRMPQLLQPWATGPGSTWRRASHARLFGAKLETIMLQLVHGT